jgi:hypothetical protein
MNSCWRRNCDVSNFKNVQFLCDCHRKQIGIQYFLAAISDLRNFLAAISDLRSNSIGRAWSRSDLHNFRIRHRL